MFRKIVSNIAFSPALVGQLGFYARRLRKEEATRRIGLIFTVLALVVQAFAVFTPPESANAANGNNIIYSGFKSKSELLSIYDRNQDSAGHKDLQQVYAQFGITRQDIANGSWGTFNSRDFSNGITSIGRSASFAWQRDPYKITNTSTTVYGSKLSKFDSSSRGTSYTGVIGKRASDGQWFAIMSGCGNAAFIKLAPPPVTPAASCSALTITPLSRTKYSFNAKATITNGATISGYTYVVKDSTGAVVTSQKLATPAAVSALTYNFAKDGAYTVNVIVSTSAGEKTSADCQKSLTVTPQPPCVVNPSLPKDSPDCKPCENDNTVWYKDSKCHSEFLFTKSVKNISQGLSDANNTTSMPSDRLEYHLIVKNVGKTTGSYVISDNLSDALEYADLTDAGGGAIAKNDGITPVEDVNTISWPAIEIKPGQTIEKIISVQVKSIIPSTPRSVGNQESYNCRMVNSLGDSETIVKVDCPTPKLVEQTVAELPHTGASENMIFAGAVLAIVVYFYARARQVKKEVRLVRRDLNAGTI
jgi:hypothetical protein